MNLTAIYLEANADPKLLATKHFKKQMSYQTLKLLHILINVRDSDNKSHLTVIQMKEALNAKHGNPTKQVNKLKELSIVTEEIVYGGAKGNKRYLVFTPHIVKLLNLK